MKQQWSQPRTSLFRITARVVLAVCLSALAIFLLAACGDSSTAEPASTPTPRIRLTLLPTDTPLSSSNGSDQKARASVNDDANLRSGPGTEYERVGSAAPGDVVEIVARNAAGDWFLLASGAWIAAFLLDDAPAGLPVADTTSTPTPTAPAVAAQAASNVPAGAVAARLIDVVDGDTINVVIDGRQERVRYIGIDTPERGQPGYRAATDANARLLGAGDLYLVADRTDRDRYGRLLRYVYTPDGVLVNQELVAQGWAQPVEYPPDTRFAAEFRAAATDAAQTGLGFWSGTATDGAMPYALVAGRANIRKGPGTGFDINTTVPASTPLTVFGRTPDGEWLQVRAPDRTGGWISAGLVALAVAVSQVEVARDIPAAPVVAGVDTTRSGALPAPVAPSAPGTTASTVRIVQLSPAGRDEFVVIQNTGAEVVDLSGWSIQSYGGNTCLPVPEQVFTFPGGFQLAAGASVRVHSGPDAFGNPPGDLLWTIQNMWHNDNDRADLRNTSGQVVSTWGYGRCR